MRIFCMGAGLLACLLLAGACTDAPLEPGTSGLAGERAPTAAVSGPGEPGESAATPTAPGSPEAGRAGNEPEEFAVDEVTLENPQAVASGINGFGLRVLQQAVQAAPDSNVLVSPLSLGSAFAMLAEGAQGTTREALFSALGLADAMGPVDVGALSGIVTRAPDDTVLTNSNGLWLADDLELEPAYVRAVRAGFAAAVETVDFADPQTLPAINGWFAEHTRGKIPELFDELGAATRLVIGNALYFKGSWSSAFDPVRTRDASFHAPGGDIQVPTLHKTFERVSYHDDGGGQALALRFGEGHFEMLFLLPPAGADPASLLAPDAQGRLASLDGSWRRAEVEVALPKFDLATGGSIDALLRNIGLARLFADPELGGISSAEALYVDEVVHKVTLAVDETGAEAAAATGMAMKTTSMSIVERVRFIVDRPFAVVIRHRLSNTIVVAGVIHDPRGTP